MGMGMGYFCELRGLTSLLGSSRWGGSEVLERGIWLCGTGHLAPQHYVSVLRYLREDPRSVYVGLIDALSSCEYTCFLVLIDTLLYEAALPLTRSWTGSLRPLGCSVAFSADAPMSIADVAPLPSA